MQSKAWSQSTLPASDPCYKDNKSEDCLADLRSTAMSLATSFDSQKKYTNYFNAYLKHYGKETLEESVYQNRFESLFEFTLKNSDSYEINRKLILDFPKGKILNNKNIFGLIIPERSPSIHEQSINRYIQNIETLFPKELNDDFSYTRELFDLPWEDPLFPDEYIKRIEKTISDIDSHNDFFKRTNFQLEKTKLLELVERLSKLSDIPKQTCNLQDIEEYQKIKIQYGDITKGKQNDVMSCLINQGNFHFAKQLIEADEYQNEKLLDYFEETEALNPTNLSIAFSQFLYSKLKSNELIPLQLKNSEERRFVYKGSYFLSNEEVECLHSNTKNTLESLNKDMQDILFNKAYEIIEQAIQESDPKKQEDLINEFIKLKSLGLSTEKMHPTKNQTVLQLLASAGAGDVLKLLFERQIHHYELGVFHQSVTEPIIVTAARGGTKKHLDFISIYYPNMGVPQYSELIELRKELNKIKTKDSELKEQIKNLRWKIRYDLYDAH
jgi:hypothetical protein